MVIQEMAYARKEKYCLFSKCMYDRKERMTDYFTALIGENIFQRGKRISHITNCVGETQDV